MFGYIRKSNIQDYVKKAERRAVQKTTKVYQSKLRRKNNEIRKLKNHMNRVNQGFGIYLRKREKIGNFSEDIYDRLTEFQNRVNRAIGLLKGDIDNMGKEISLDAIDDKMILKMIK